MPVMEMKVIPLGTPTASVSEFLVPVVRILKQEQDFKYHITSMGTIIEGPSLETLYVLAAKIHQAVLVHADRVVVFLEVDERKDKVLSMDGKVRSLEEKARAQ